MGRWLLRSRASNFIITMCILLQVVHCGIWLATSPPFIDKDAHSQHRYIIIICNKGSDIAFYGILGFLGTLAIGQYMYMYMNLPDTFNEAKFLAFSMLMFCSVWISFLPVYQSTKRKVMVSMEFLSILAIQHHLCSQVLHYIIKAINELISSHKGQSIHQKEKTIETPSSPVS
ncbi:Vomeronasal type-2 receptor 116 [Lemmus lemmus]